MLLSRSYAPEVQRGALSGLRKVRPDIRRRRLIKVLHHYIQQPQGYDPDVMICAVDLLATDPSVEATAALLELLPSLAQSALRRRGISEDFRAYYYNALMTRRRAEDRASWRDYLLEFGWDTWVGLVLDPAAAPLEDSLHPLRQIDRLPRAQRGQALRAIIGRGLVRGAPQKVLQAVRLMLRGEDTRDF
ncbi:MAG: hypothetical protein Kow00124_28670 [Anaerolineae bacterium]